MPTLTRNSITHRDVLIALSFSKVMLAVLPVFSTLTSFPQKEKKSCSFSSVVSAARPATWMVYPGAMEAEVEAIVMVCVWSVWIEVTLADIFCRDTVNVQDGRW